jgi:activator of 2-hydroxyglutaryl-CoA dehydratase
VRALEEALDYNVFVPEIPDTVGALGAALFAMERSLQ